MRNKKVIQLIIMSTALLLLASCAPGPNPIQDTGVQIYGFWAGLWHGMVSPFTFIMSLFNDSIHFYEVYNNGGWYNFGFLLGIGAFASGSSSSKRSR